MLNCWMKNPIYINENLRDICTKSKNETIRKLTQKYDLERKNKRVVNLLAYDDSNRDPFDFNFFHIFLFLSLSSVTLYFYRRLK